MEQAQRRATSDRWGREEAATCRDTGGGGGSRGEDTSAVSGQSDDNSLGAAEE
jgi:hypothetical protein